MIDLYSTGAPNGRKITIFCEEAGLPYRLHLIDLYTGAHRQPGFLAINPNGRIPAIRDPEGPDGPLVLWESGAILQYLAEKTGRFLPASGPARWEVLKWLFFQVSHAPYWGQAHVFRLFTPEPIPFCIDRYTRESHRLYRLLDDHLTGRDWMAGGAYSIADMALFPWVEYHPWQGVALEGYPAVAAWFERMAARPAVARGRTDPWGVEAFGPSPQGAAVGRKVAERLADPEFGARPAPEGAAPAGVTGWIRGGTGPEAGGGRA